MMYWLAIACALLAGSCTSPAAAPALPDAVVTLAAEYENPSAALDASNARTVFVQTAVLRGALESISGLRFIREVLDDAVSIDQADDVALDVHGALDARSACPGWEAGAQSDAAIDGAIEVTIGVEDSRVQRAFSGRTLRCRFVTQLAGQSANAEMSADIEVDLGGALGLGEEVRSVLVRATNLTGSVAGVPLSLPNQVLSFRLLADGSVETLVDMATLPVRLAGTALVVLRPDGSWALRAAGADWLCSNEGSAPCVRAPAV